MFSFDESRAVKLLAIFITSAACIARYRILLAEFAMQLILLWGVFLLLYYKKQICFSEDVAGYLKAYGVFALSVIPSILFSDDVSKSILVFFRMWVWPYVPFIFIILFINRRDYLTNMLTMFSIFFGVECLYTLVQTVNHMGTVNRAWGFSSNVLLSIADVMCMMLPLALVILMDGRFERRLKRAAAFSVVGIIVGLLCNKSRGAWLTELIVVPLASFSYLKHNKKYLIVFLLVLMGMIGYMVSKPQYMQRIYSITNTTTDHSNADRIWTWKSAKLMIEDYPVTGIGLGLFREKYKKYKFEQETQNLAHTHNNFIQVTVESGIIGLAGFLIFAGYYLYKSWKDYKCRLNPYDLLFFTTFFGHICIFGQIEFTLWHGAEGQPVFWFLMAILLKMKELDEQYVCSHW